MTAHHGPGRSCPNAYRYSPRSFDRAPELEAATLYVVGGLHGNVEAKVDLFASSHTCLPALRAHRRCFRG